MTASNTHRWLASSKRNPCPICGRTKDGDCRITADGQAVICHYGQTHHPPEGLTRSQVITGHDGQSWAFTGKTEDNRAATFTIDKPREAGITPRSITPRKVVPLRPAASPPPAPINGPVVVARLPQQLIPSPPPEHLPDGHRLDYSPTQWTQIKDHGERPRHLAGGEVTYSAGPDPWPLYGHHLLEHATGQWIAAAEGPKCATWLQAGGLVAVSQPGHDHKADSIARRFRDLQGAGIAGMIYLADHDATGQRKAEQLAAGAAAAGLPFIAVAAAEVWPDLPQGGSIDDAPGTAADRVAALLAFIADDDDDDLALRREALAHFRKAQATTIDLADTFGPFWGDRLTDRAAAFPCDPVLLVPGLLGYVASLVGTKARVRVKDGWSEPMVIWALAAMQASSLKSPAAAVVGDPLADLQDTAHQAYVKAQNAHKAREKKWRSDCRAAEKAAKEAGTEAAELPEPPEPPAPPRHYYVESITIERLAAIHSQGNVPGLLAFHDELSDWFASLERNSKATDRPRWLKLWSGSAIKHDTVTATTAFTKHSAVSMVGFIQPDKLAELHAAEGSGPERSGDGLWARFLPVIPQSVPFEFNPIEVVIKPELIALAHRLEAIPPNTTFTFDSDAIATVMAPAWQRWAAAEGDSAAARQAFIGKLRGYSVRLAGLLHLIHEEPGTVIGSRIAGKAVDLAEFFLAQFDQLAPQISSGEDVSPAVARFLARVRDRQLAEVRVRDLQRWKLLGRDATADEAEQFLRELAEIHGIGVIEQLHTKGSRRGALAWKPA